MRLRFWRRRQRDAELDEEIRGHLDMAARDRMTRGEAPEDAAYAARREFGNVGQVKELTRQMWAGASVERLLDELRHALRALRRTPGFTLTTVFILALGIAAAGGMFSLANWLALRPVPGVSDQGRLAVVDFGRAEASYPDLHDLGERISAFSQIAGLWSTVPMVIGSERAVSRYVQGTLVSADYFAVLGTRMARGRPFDREEGGTGGGSLPVVISDRVWHTMFAADPHVVGRAVTVNGVEATVTGVTPNGFHGIELLGHQDVWAPASAWSAIAHLPGGASVVSSRTSRVFTQFVGRLAPGTTIEQARTQLGTAVSALGAAYPVEKAGWTKAPPTLHVADGLSGPAREYVRRVLGVLLGVAGLVLLLACANVANLLLSRGVSRRGEVAVRRALGGSCGRLIRAQLLEALLIAAAAGVVGLVLAFWLASLFQGMTLPGGNPWVYNGIGEPTLDWRVLSFVVVVTLAAGLAAGILPGWVSARANLVESLRASGATGVVGPGRLRGSLVAVQLGVSLALLVTALLLARTVRNLAQIPVGFDADRVTAFAISPPYSGYGREQAQMILRRVVAQVRTVPGVEDAALSASTPFSSTIDGAVQQKGATASDPSAPVVSAWVGPDYFRTIGVHLLAGRGFSDDEEFLPIARASEDVAVISGSQAKALFGTTDAVGRVVQNKDGFGSSYRIIGVVPDTRWAGLLPGSDEAPFYQPLPSFAEGGTILVRSLLPVAALRPAVERAVAAVAPSVPVFDVERLSEKIHRSVAEQRLLAKILSAFTLLAVALAGAGLYAVVAFSVAERTRELGIRIALGARAGQVVGLVVRRGIRLGAAGLAFGIAGAIALGRVVATQLYGVGPLDAASYLAATIILFALVLVASALPARRATHVDPIDVLRQE